MSAEHVPAAVEDLSAPVAAFPSAARTVEHVVAVAGPAIALQFEAALPAPQILRALAGEVRKAITNPKGVPHPELADPDAYWRLSAFPHAACSCARLT